MAGNSILVINAAGAETRVALVESGNIHEYYLERKREKGIVGNIYKGRVVRVLPGMQAAFVDIGLEKAAFLYVGDVYGDPDFSEEFELTEGEHRAEVEAAEVPSEQEAEEAEARAAQLAAEPPPTTPAEPGMEVAPGEAAVESASQEGAPPPLPTGEPGAGAPTLVAAAEAPIPEAPADVAGLRPEPLVSMPIAQEIGMAPVPAIPGLPVPAEPTQAAEAAPQAGPAAPEAEAAAASEGPEGEAAGGEEAAAPDQGSREVRATEAAREARGDQTPAQGRERDRGRRDERGRREGREGRDRDGRDRNGGRNGHREEKRKDSKTIQDLLKEGQEVIVQVAKDPIGTKGARITSHISLPGRHLVFMPTVDHIGISRRIEKDAERRRLRDFVDRMRPEGTGFIVRTVAENVEQSKLEADIRFLIQVWNEIIRTKDKVSAPALLHGDLDLILRATRDLFTADVNKLVIDERDEYERILRFVREQAPHLETQIEYYSGQEPIFDAYGIEQELKRAAQR